MTTQQTALAVAGFGMIGFVCWLTASAYPLWALIPLVWLVRGE